MRIATAQRIYRNSNQCLYYDYLKYAPTKTEFYKRRRDHLGLLHSESFKKECLGVPTFRYVELYNGGINTSVAIYFAPSRIPVRPLFQGPDANECFTYKRHVFLLGLAAGLVSLGSLWLYNIFEWCSNVFMHNNYETGNDCLDECKQRTGCVPKTTPSFGETTTLVQPRETKKNQFSSVYNTSYHYGYPLHYEKKSPEKYDIRTSGAVSNNLSSSYDIHLGHGPNLLWTSACMNCPHFASGSNKICTICWLNMPDYWLNGPTWFSSTAAFHISQLYGNTSILGFLICLQLLYKAVCLACCKSVAKRSCSTQTNFPSPSNSVNNDCTNCSQQLLNTSFKFDGECVTTNNLAVTRSISETVVSDDLLSQFAKDRLNSPELGQSLQVSKSFDMKFGGNDLYDSNEQSLKQLSMSIDNVFFPSMKDERMQYPFTTSELLLCDEDFIPAMTFSLSTDQLVSNVVDLLGTKQPDYRGGSSKRKSLSSPSSSSLIQHVHSDAVLKKKIERNESVNSLLEDNNSASQNINNSLLSHRSSFHSNSGSLSSSASLSCSYIDDNEGFEYDDIISIEMNKNPVKIEDCGQSDHCNEEDNIDEEDMEEGDEIILRQLDTLSSLLNSKSDSYSLEQLNESPSLLNKVADVNDATDDAALVTSAPSSFVDRQLNNSLACHDTCKLGFTNLSQKTLLITDELNKLSDTLDRLLYKLQANQIQLDQAEDNLDYMWYLKDNLDEESSLDTSECYSTAALSDMDAEGLLHEDTSEEEDHVDADDYWLSKGRMSVSSSHPSDCHSDRHTYGYLSNSHGMLNNHFYSTLRIPRFHYDNISNMDSGLEQSVITCSESSTHMISSMPEDQLKTFLSHNSSYHNNNNNNRYLSNSQTFKDPLHSISKYSRFKKRHYRMKRMVNHKTNRFSTEIIPDSDGFLHPDFTFENDGFLDWSEPMKENPI
ncbi:unnamed protein product [Trichobilharzia szidati]|nr:unnamed protein product [Trichobilharzia szidati]